MVVFPPIFVADTKIIYGYNKESCSENIQQLYRRTPMPKNKDVLLYICCIFLEHLCIRTPLKGCFCKKDTITGFFLWIYLCEYISFIFYFFVSDKIDICLIVKVLLLRRIKVLNKNLNKIKNHVRKFDVRSHVTQEL